MKHSCIAVMFLAIASMCLAHPAHSAKSDQALPKLLDGVILLRRAGVKSASDIESVVIPFIDFKAYKLTSRANGREIERLYKSLHRLTLVEWPWPIPAWGRLIINTRTGKTVSVIFTLRNPDDNHDPTRVSLAASVQAPDLVPFFRDLMRNRQAAALDDSIPPLDVCCVWVGLPATSPNGFSPSSEKAKRVLATALAIIDELDPRAGFATPVSEMDMIMACAKFGSVTLSLLKPVRVETYLKGSEKSYIHGEAGLFRPGIQRKLLTCNKLIVMEYGNYHAPVVILQDTAKRYYLFSRLARKLWRDWVPGSESAIPEGYKSPADLYKDLQEQAKAAYKSYVPETDSAPESARCR